MRTTTPVRCSNALNHDNGYYAVVHVDHKFDLKVDDELEGNINVFTKQINAPTQSRKKRKFVKGPGEQLPAEEFTFESSELVGKGIVIVEGRRVYMVAAFGSKPHDRKAAVDRFMKSFKFQAPDKKNQDPPKVAKTKAKAKDSPGDAGLCSDGDVRPRTARARSRVARSSMSFRLRASRRSPSSARMPRDGCAAGRRGRR